MREMVGIGPRSAIMTLPDGCVACVTVGGERRLLRVWIDPREAVAAVGSGRRVPGGLRRLALRGQDDRGGLRFGVACGAESTMRLGAGLIDPRAVDRMLAETTVEQLTPTADVS